MHCLVGKQRLLLQHEPFLSLSCVPLTVGERLGRGHYAPGLCIPKNFSHQLLMLIYYTETGVLEGEQEDPENSATSDLSLCLRRFYFGDLIARKV